MSHFSQELNEHVIKKMFPTHIARRAPHRKITGNINMCCGMRPLTAVLYDLALRKPYLFIDNFNAYRNPRRNKNGTTQPLNVQMTLSTYMHQRIKQFTP